MSAIVATSNGERRYHRWTARHGLTPSDSREIRATLLADLCLAADGHHEREVRDLLGEPGRIPLCVVDHVVKHASLTIMSDALDGLCGLPWAPHPAADEPRRPLTVVERLAPPTSWWRRRRRPSLVALLAHELAHHWLERNDLYAPAPARAARRTLWTAAREFGPVPLQHLIDRELRDDLTTERRANRLAESWGFLQPHESAWCPWLTRKIAAEADA